MMSIWLSEGGVAATFFANFSIASLTSADGAPPPWCGRNMTFFHHVTLRGSRNGGVEKLMSTSAMSLSCSSAFVEVAESTTSSPVPSP